MAARKTIIAVADANHYLVGITDQEGNFSAIPELGSVQICQSLSAAKQVLREQNVRSARLIMQSPYDEMCGLDAAQEYHYTVSL